MNIGYYENLHFLFQKEPVVIPKKLHVKGQKPANVSKTG